jgi:hypothetical protein
MERCRQRFFLKQRVCNVLLIMHNSIGNQWTARDFLKNFKFGMHGHEQFEIAIRPPLFLKNEKNMPEG